MSNFLDNFNASLASLSVYLDSFNSVVWGEKPVLVVLIFAIIISFAIGFVQMSRTKLMYKLSFDSSSSDAGISSFQALVVSLSGRVGTGNIVGVSSAIFFGGPGAVFWMWMCAIFMSSLSFIESILGQLFKVEYQGTYRASVGLYANGLLQRYIKSKTLIRTVVVFLSFVCMVVFGLTLLPIQANAIGENFEEFFGVHTSLTGIILAVIFLLVVAGGIKRIADIAEKLVMFMGGAFLFIFIVMMIVYYQNIPGVIYMIFANAFSPHAAFGGVFGAALVHGMRRGVLSHEAGMGSAGPHIGGIAEVSHPGQQGYVQSFAVLIDTLFFCTVTAFILLLSGIYSMQGIDGNLIYSGIDAGVRYQTFVGKAVGTVLPLGPQIMTIVITLFAFTTILSNYYAGESNAAILDSFKPQPKIFGQPLIIVFLQSLGALMLYIGATGGGALAWGLTDAGVFLVLWCNMLLMSMGACTAIKVLKDYNKKVDSGAKIDAVPFCAKTIGITDDLPYWNSRNVANKQ